VSSADLHCMGDAPVCVHRGQESDTGTKTGRPWLAKPCKLRAALWPDPAMALDPPRKALRLRRLRLAPFWRVAAWGVFQHSGRNRIKARAAAFPAPPEAMRPSEEMETRDCLGRPPPLGFKARKRSRRIGWGALAKWSTRGPTEKILLAPCVQFVRPVIKAVRPALCQRKNPQADRSALAVR
jgi:hypothetical protein